MDLSGVTTHQPNELALKMEEAYTFELLLYRYIYQSKNVYNE